MPSDTVMLVGTFIPIAAILVGGMLILIPVAGLTLRFALKPTLESLGWLRDARSQSQELRLVEQRLALLEEQMHALARAAGRGALSPEAVEEAVVIGRIVGPSAGSERPTAG